MLGCWVLGGLFFINVSMFCLGKVLGEMIRKGGLYMKMFFVVRFFGLDWVDMVLGDCMGGGVLRNGFLERGCGGGLLKGDVGEVGEVV